MSPYPNAHEIEEIFFHRINTDEFHKHLADHIDITVTGSDFNISGSFKSMEEFHEKIYVRINAAVKQETLRLEVNRVIGGGDSPVNTLSALNNLFDCIRLFISMLSTMKYLSKIRKAHLPQNP